MLPNLPLLGEVRRRFGFGRRNALKPGRCNGGRRWMPHGRDGFRRHHVVRKDPRRVEVRTSAKCIEKTPRLRGPAHIPKVLPGVIERIVPTTRAHLISPLRVRDGAPYPANTRVFRRMKIFGWCNVDAASADVERKFSHITVYRLYLLRLAILRKTQSSTPRLLSFFLCSTDGLQTNFFYLIAQKFDVAARGMEPGAFARLVSRHSNHKLYPHLLRRFQTAQKLEWLRERVNFIFFLRIFIELKINVRAQLIRETK